LLPKHTHGGRLLRRILLALALLAAAPALAQQPKKVLTVAAAANLKTAVEELKAAFEAETPGSEAALTFGASGALFAQIRQGAPFDVFLSADREYPAKVIAAKLGAAADEKIYALGKVVAWLPPGSTLDLEKRGLAALADPGVKRIAIANPAVAPFGRATVSALESAGIHDAVKEKLVLGTSVAQTAQFATAGAADVAFVPYSLTFGKELAGGKVVFLPEALHPRIEQSGIVLRTARDPALARAFLAFLTGEKGRAILAKYGYGLP
jgi:molybdate transport system substrate-binding protein